MGRDGLPLSWRHYIYGVRYLARAHVRAQLDLAEATRMAGAVGDDFVTWQTDMRQRLEVPRG